VELHSHVFYTPSRRDASKRGNFVSLLNNCVRLKCQLCLALFPISKVIPVILTCIQHRLDSERHDTRTDRQT
jgi:hypothetical protein